MASGSVSATIRPAARTRTLPNPDRVDARWDTTIKVEVERYSDTLRRIRASDRRIKAGSGLVENQDARSLQECSCNRQTLALTS